LAMVRGLPRTARDEKNVPERRVEKRSRAKGMRRAAASAAVGDGRWDYVACLVKLPEHRTMRLGCVAVECFSGASPAKMRLAGWLTGWDC
jgi:hypothetical protein